MQFYVYAHLNPVTLTPFYIGKGKESRYKEKTHRSDYWKNYTNKYGFIPLKLVDGLTDAQACEIEKQYILKHGFVKTGGSLINQTAGGTGGNTFDPINKKNWNSGKVGVYSEQSIQKMRDARLGKKLQPDQKEKVLAGLKKAATQSLISRTHKVKCLITGEIWNNRNECIESLGLNIKSYSQRVFKNKPIKGNHLQLIKN